MESGDDLGCREGNCSLIRVASVDTLRKGNLIRAILFWGGMALLYLLTYRGSPRISDEVYMLGITSSIVERGSVDVDQLSWLFERVPERFGPDGRRYTRFGVGLPLVAAPAYFIGEYWPISGAEQFAGYPIGPLASIRLVMTSNILFTALTAFGVWRIVRVLGFSPRTAALTTAGYSVGSMAWPYTETFFSEPLMALGLTWAIVWTLRFAQDGGSGKLWAAGLALSLAAVARPATMLLVPVFVFYIALGSRGYSRQLLIPVAVFGLSLLPGLGINATYNFLRFGDFLNTGFHFKQFINLPLEPLLAFLISPSRGVFWLNPVLLLGIPGSFLLLRRDHRTVLFLSLLMGLHTVFYALYARPYGGWAWGPRYLLSVIPVAMIFTAPLWEKFWTGSRTLQTTVIILTVLSVAVQLVATLADWSLTFQLVSKEYGIRSAQFLWGPSHSLIWRQVTTLFSSPPDSFLAQQLQASLGSAGRVLWFMALLGLLAFVWGKATRFPGTQDLAPLETRK